MQKKETSLMFRRKPIDNDPPPPAAQQLIDAAQASTPSAVAWAKLNTRRRWTVRVMMASAVASTIGMGMCIHLAAPADDQFRSGNSTNAGIVALSGVMLALFIYVVDSLIDDPAARLRQFAGISAGILVIDAVGLVGSLLRGAASTEEIVAGAAFFAIAVCTVIASWGLSRTYSSAMKAVEPEGAR